MSVAYSDDDDPDAELSHIVEDNLARRRTTVMFLRNGGASWTQISGSVGVSIDTCRRDYKLVCRDINGEDPSMTLARHRAVIFDICRANYGRMMGNHAEDAQRAAMTILKALERESKLLGMDQPVRLLATVNTENFESEAARLITFIQEHDADTLKELTRGQETQAHPVIEGTIDPPTMEPGQPDCASTQPGHRAADVPAEPERGRGASDRPRAPSPWETRADAGQRREDLVGPEQPGPSDHDPQDGDGPDEDNWSNIGD